MVDYVRIIIIDAIYPVLNKEINILYTLYNSIVLIIIIKNNYCSPLEDII